MKQQPYALFIGILAGALLALQGAAHAQSVTIFGSLGNFDVANNQQQDAHGFEVELRGVQPTDIASVFSLERYGDPTIIPTATGTIVRWASAFDAATGFGSTTVPHATPQLAGTCYQWAGPSYDGSGCEHFGIGLTVNAAVTTYRWLVADATTPGALIPGPVPVAVATPSYSAGAATALGAATLNADVDAPVDLRFPTHYGDAFWLKVFKAPSGRAVALEELTNDNPSVVPESGAQLEASWTLIQADPLVKFSTSGKTSPSRGRTRNGGAVAVDTRAVVRRYEVYDYTGTYDAVFHQALCAVSNCANPADGEVGDLVSAQMTAANLLVPSITVAATGSGTVSSSDRRIHCGSTCMAAYSNGDVVTLTATAAAGAVFSGWSGACTGSASSCTVAVNDHLSVAAAFAAAPSRVAPSITPTTTTPAPTTAVAAVKISVGLSNKGRITGVGLDCPNSSCSAKVAAGSTVTLTATATGTPFVGWGGACTGTAPTCTLTVTKDTQIDAKFAK